MNRRTGGAKARKARSVQERTDEPVIMPDALVASLTLIVLAVHKDTRILFANPAAEPFFGLGCNHLTSQCLDEFIPADSPVFALIHQSLSDGADLSDFGVTLESPRIGTHVVNLVVSPMADIPDVAVVTIHTRTLADRIAGQLSFRGAARSVTAMAATLAHEIKNPLSGIRGAAQLLEQTVEEDDRSLARLIADETQRINSLIEHMDIFADDRPISCSPVNIHRVLDRVRDIAIAGFGRGVTFVEQFDPSLPPVNGNRDLLIQVFLNLVKNAVEAVPKKGGEIILETAYHHGYRLTAPGRASRIHLPLVVTVSDNGPGIPESIRPHLFDPFVSSHSSSRGLGLALVAKLIADHGGLIDHSREDGHTRFRVFLPLASMEGQP